MHPTTYWRETHDVRVRPIVINEEVRFRMNVAMRDGLLKPRTRAINCSRTFDTLEEALVAGDRLAINAQ